MVWQYWNISYKTTNWWAVVLPWKYPSTRFREKFATLLFVSIKNKDET